MATQEDRDDPVADWRRESLARAAAEAERYAAVLAQAAVPEACGPEIPAAPGRGKVEAFRPVEMVRGSTVRFRDAGWMGRRALRCRDAFDEMADQAARAGGKLELFTPGQIGAGRDYAALVERVAAAGVKCSAVDSTGGGGGGTGWIEAVIRDVRRLEALQSRIGDGTALAVRRVRPSARGGPDRQNIRTRAIVELVCVGGLTVAEVLERHGWHPKTAKNRAAVIWALRQALDRMQGYGLARPQDVG